MASAAADSPHARPAFGAGYRLLIVDDEETVRKVLALVLRPTGFDITTAEDVGSALRHLQSTTFDVVVTDKNLPDGSGLDVARYLTDRKADTSVVMITGYGSHESALEALRLGIVDYLSKPFVDLDAVRNCVRGALERCLDRRMSAELARSATPPRTEAERRLRFQVERKLRFVLVDGTLSRPALCSSLSMVDLFVETAAVLPPGLRVKMQLDLPDETVELHGVVLRAGEGRRNRGLRIELVDLDAKTEGALASFLEPERAKLRAPSPPSTSREETAEVVAKQLAALAETGPDDDLAPDPDIEEIVRRWATEGDGNGAQAPAPSDATATAAEPAPAAETAAAAGTPPTEPAAPDVQARFDLDAFALFRTMQPQQERLRSLMADSRTLEAEREASSAVAIEEVEVSMLDEGAKETPPAGEDVEARLREKYGLKESVVDVEELQKKYGIDDALFDDEPAEPTPPPRPGGPSIPPPPWENTKATSAEQRKAFAQELRRRAEESMARGLVVKAASDLALAVVFDPADAGLKKLHDDVRAKASEARADATFREGLQQLALGDKEAAAQLLLTACKARFDLRYVTACGKVLLHLGTPEALREARTLLRAAMEKEPKSAALHVLLGGLAEAEGLPKVAVRLYRKALEIEPENVAALERCKALGDA